MGEKTVAIIANGTFQMAGPVPALLDRAEMVICADGGADHALRIGILPQLVLGDLDSISPETREIFKAKGIPLLPFPREKDKTDMELAVEFAFKEGAGEIFLLGGTGSRLDHTLANIQLLTRSVQWGIGLTLADHANLVHLVDGKIDLVGEAGQYLSLLPMSHQVKGVNTWGLKFPLEDATLVWGSSWGISNEFEGERARVEVAKGQLLVIQVWEGEGQTK